METGRLQRDPLPLGGWVGAAGDAAKASRARPVPPLGAPATTIGLIVGDLGQPYAHLVGRRMIARLQNPCSHTCGCLPSCWCYRTWLGYAIRWYTPRRFHRLPRPFRIADALKRRPPAGGGRSTKHGPTGSPVRLRLVGSRDDLNSLVDLALVCRTGVAADNALCEAIASARAAGHSWSEIAAAMGLSSTVSDGQELAAAVDAYRRQRWTCAVDDQ